MPESDSGNTLPPSDNLVWHYKRLWDEGRLPDLASFLAGKGDVSIATLVDLLDVDQVNRWAVGRRVRAEEYLAAYPRLWDDHEHALRLVYGEFLLRERHGEFPEAVDFAARFPALAERLAQEIELHRAPALPAPDKPTELSGLAAPGRMAFRSPGAPKVPGFEILGELGRGGMGVVYQARQAKLSRLVALKFLTSGEDLPEILLRFRREAESAARLAHPNIVQIYEVGEVGNRPFIVMEHVAGGSLADRLDGTPQPPGWSAELVATLSRAVHFAHLGGIMHRDLKPGNVLLSRRASCQLARAEEPAGSLLYDPKITDFGLAKQLDAQQGQTGTNLIVGTPSYMAPEQAAGSKAIGPAADTYALGVILYECLTGRTPFRGGDVIETLQQLRFEDPVPPSRLRPGLPRDLETICLKCLEKDPQRRYSSAAALADDLERYRDGRPILARPTSSAEHLWKWAKRRPAVAILSAATAVSTLLGVILYSVLMARNAAEREERGRAEGLYLAEQVRREEAEKRVEAEEWSAYVSGLGRAQQFWASDVAGEGFRVSNLLAALPARRRGWEVALFQQPRHAPWGTLSGGLGEVTSVAYSPDGRLLAVGAGITLTEGGKPRAVQLWDLTTKTRLANLDGLTDPVSCVAFSPCGKFLIGATSWFDQKKLWQGDLKAATSPRGRVVVWELASRRIVQELNGVYHDARFSSDGRRFFATGLGRLAHVWDVTASPWKELPALPAPVGPIAVSAAVAPGPDGKRLVTLQQEFLAAMPGDLRVPSTALVWDVDSRKPLFRIDGPPSVVRAVAYSPDGRRIVTGSLDGVVKIWDADTGRLLDTCRGHAGEVQAVAFNRDGTRFATGGLDEAVKVWVTATGREVASIRGHASKILTIAFDPSSPPGDERLASGDKAGVAKIWDLRGTRQPREFLGHARSPITDLAFSGDGRTLASTCQQEARVIVWDTATGKPRQRFEAPAERIALSPDGKLLATAGGLKLEEPGHLKVWDVGGRLLHEIKGHPLYVYSVAFSPDGRFLLSASGNPRDDKPGFVKVHDVATGAERASFRPDVGVVSAVAWHPQGEQIALTGQEKVAVICRWDGTSPRRFTGISKYPTPLAFSPTGTTLACGDLSGDVYLWDADTDGEPRRLSGHRTAVSKLSFHPDGKRLASTGHAMFFDGSDVRLHPEIADVRLWDLPTGREVLVMPGFMAAVFSPAGNDLALVGREVDMFAGGKIELWNAKPPTTKP